MKPLLQCSSSPSTAVNFNISCREIRWHICPGMSCDLTPVFLSFRTKKIHIFEAFKDKWGREQMYIPKCGYNLVWQIWENSPVPLKQSIFREQEKYKILFPRQPSRKHQHSIAKLTSLQAYRAESRIPLKNVKNFQGSCQKKSICFYDSKMKSLEETAWVKCNWGLPE